MNRDGRRAGLGGVLFAASLAVGFTLFGPWLPGPFYVVILWGLVVGIWLLVSPAGHVD